MTSTETPASTLMSRENYRKNLRNRLMKLRIKRKAAEAKNKVQTPQK